MARSKEAKQLLYWTRRFAGVCVLCGRPCAPSRCCEKCRKKVARAVRKVHKKRKANGRCPMCGKTEPAPGRVNCPACMDKSINSVLKKYHSDPVRREQHKQRVLERRHRYAAAGRCMCGKSLPGDGGAACLSCRESSSLAKAGVSQHAQADMERREIYYANHPEKDPRRL